MLTIAEARRTPRLGDAKAAAGAPIGEVRPVVVDVAAAGERGVVRGTAGGFVDDLDLAIHEAGNASRRRRSDDGDDWDSEGEGAHVGWWLVSV